MFGCSDAASELGEERVAPFDLVLSDHRVVLTPGGSATVRIDILRSEDPEHPSSSSSTGSRATLDAYFIEHAMQIELELGDAEVDNPSTYRLTARRSGEPTVVITDGSVTVFDAQTTEQRTVVWTPEDDLVGWPLCSSPSEDRGYELVLEATDSAGSSATVHGRDHARVRPHLSAHVR